MTIDREKNLPTFFTKDRKTESLQFMQLYEIKELQLLIIFYDKQSAHIQVDICKQDYKAKYENYQSGSKHTISISLTS